MKYTIHIIADGSSEVNLTLDLRRRKERDLLEELMEYLKESVTEDLEALRASIDAEGMEGVIAHFHNDPHALRAALKPYDTGLDETEVSKALVDAIERLIESRDEA